MSLATDDDVGDLRPHQPDDLSTNSVKALKITRPQIFFNDTTGRKNKWKKITFTKFGDDKQDNTLIRPDACHSRR